MLKGLVIYRPRRRPTPPPYRAGARTETTTMGNPSARAENGSNPGRSHPADSAQQHQIRAVRKCQHALRRRIAPARHSRSPSARRRANSRMFLSSSTIKMRSFTARIPLRLRYLSATVEGTFPGGFARQQSAATKETFSTISRLARHPPPAAGGHFHAFRAQNLDLFIAHAAASAQNVIVGKMGRRTPARRLVAACWRWAHGFGHIFLDRRRPNRARYIAARMS